MIYNRAVLLGTRWDGAPSTPLGPHLLVYEPRRRTYSITPLSVKPYLRAVWHPQHILMGRLGSAKLDSTVACSIMFLGNVHHDNANGSNGAAKEDKDGTERTFRTKSGGGTVWTQKQLTCLVWALGHKNQDVLAYTAWTLYVASIAML